MSIVKVDLVSKVPLKVLWCEHSSNSFEKCIQELDHTGNDSFKQ